MGGLTNLWATTHVTPEMIQAAIERLPAVATACKAVAVDNEVDNGRGVESA